MVSAALAASDAYPRPQNVRASAQPTSRSGHPSGLCSPTRSTNAPLARSSTAYIAFSNNGGRRPHGGGCKTLLVGLARFREPKYINGHSLCSSVFGFTAAIAPPTAPPTPAPTATPTATLSSAVPSAAPTPAPIAMPSPTKEARLLPRVLFPFTMFIPLPEVVYGRLVSSS